MGQTTMHSHSRRYLQFSTDNLNSLKQKRQPMQKLCQILTTSKFLNKPVAVYKSLFLILFVDIKIFNFYNTYGNRLSLSVSHFFFTISAVIHISMAGLQLLTKAVRNSQASTFGFFFIIMTFSREHTTDVSSLEPHLLRT